jgi:LDH2 family malate/lactate/ureidoglycolate dehydrogenase
MCRVRHVGLSELTVSPAELHDFASRALKVLGFPPAQRDEVATAMVWADMRGLTAHGVVRRLAQCAARVRAGGTDPAAAPTVDDDRGGSVVTMDGHHAWGQVAGIAAMGVAIGRARQTGVGVVAVRRTGSPAALGYYPTLAVSQQMIGIALTNCPALMAAPDGRVRVVGNQAHAFGFPAGDGRRILFDSALSVMSTGEMDRRLEAAERLPDGVLRDRDGRPTNDPADWIDGFLTPIGGYRGFGLALAFELLTSALSGSGAPSYEVGTPVDHGSPQNVSMTCIAIDPAWTRPLEQFNEQVDDVARAVHLSGEPDRPAPRVPGERGDAVARQRLRTGVPVSHAQAQALERLASELGIAAPRSTSAKAGSGVS